MVDQHDDKNGLRIAVIGAGPAGVYSSDIFLRQLRKEGEKLGVGTDARIDLFEKLPVPFGLVRYGVAPDHPSIKFIADALEKTLARTPALGKCGAALRAHGEVGRLSHVCLHGVDGRGGHKRKGHKAHSEHEEHKADERAHGPGDATPGVRERVGNAGYRRARCCCIL